MFSRALQQTIKISPFDFPRDRQGRLVLPMPYLHRTESGRALCLKSEYACGPTVPANCVFKVVSVCMSDCPTASNRKIEPNECEFDDQGTLFWYVPRIVLNPELADCRSHRGWRHMFDYRPDPIFDE